MLRRPQSAEFFARQSIPGDSQPQYVNDGSEIPFSATARLALVLALFLPTFFFCRNPRLDFCQKFVRNFEDFCSFDGAGISNSKTLIVKLYPVHAVTLGSHPRRACLSKMETIRVTQKNLELIRK